MEIYVWGMKIRKTEGLRRYKIRVIRAKHLGKYLIGWSSNIIKESLTADNLLPWSVVELAMECEYGRYALLNKTIRLRGTYLIYVGPRDIKFYMKSESRMWLIDLKLVLAYLSEGWKGYWSYDWH